ncbi:acyl-ACP--UDP-N-acetylglucosamine O-acyltransferase [Myxococcota bacterium]
MLNVIHPTAVVEPDAELGQGVRIGPLCYVGAGVRIGDGTELIGQATVLGPTDLGRNCRVFPFAAVGLPPQDRTWAGEPTRLEIGDDCILREHVTVHRGTRKGGEVTRIGARCLLMVGVHVAHDCLLGNDLVLSNLTTLGGHVAVESQVVTGGHVAVAPMVRLGRGCFLAGGAMVEGPIPPYTIAAGDRARVRGINLVGLKRMGIAPGSRLALVRAYRRLWRSRVPLRAALNTVESELGSDEHVAELVAFLRAVHGPAIDVADRSTALPQ